MTEEMQAADTGDAVAGEVVDTAPTAAADPLKAWVTAERTWQWLDAEQTWHTEALTGALAVAFALQEVPLLSVHEMFEPVAKVMARTGVRSTNFVAAGQQDYLPKWIKKELGQHTPGKAADVLSNPAGELPAAEFGFASVATAPEIPAALRRKPPKAKRAQAKKVQH